MWPLISMSISSSASSQTSRVSPIRSGFARTMSRRCEAAPTLIMEASARVSRRSVTSGNSRAGHSRMTA
jgi:hypothetical protein